MTARTLLALVAALAVLPACSTESPCNGVPTRVVSTSGDTVTTSSGLRYIDLQAGSGAVVEACSPVEVRYTGQLTDGTVFDRGSFAFVPGYRQVIAGFEQAVVGMRVGGQRRAIIPPALGYGSTPQGSIPANSTLIFDIEVTQVAEQ